MPSHRRGGVVAVVPVGGSEPLRYAEQLAGAVRLHRLRPLIKTLDFPLSSREYVEHRQQYNAPSILARLAQVKEEPAELLLGATPHDLYAPGLNFIFGLADDAQGVAIVSTARLILHESPRVVEERVFKEAAHEIGHLMGLGHCPNPRCIMTFANSILDVDAKRPTLCPSCARA